MEKQTTKNSHFKVGDKVKVAHVLGCPRDYLVGAVGEISRIMDTDDGCPYEVRIKMKKSGIALPFWCAVEAFKPDKVVIYQKDERTVVANDTVSGKEATAVCSKDDTFDFAIGAELALQRLHGRVPKKEAVKKEEPKQLNCKFIVVEKPETCHCVTVGKTYEVKGGRFKPDKYIPLMRDDVKWPLYHDLQCWDDLIKYARSDGSWHDRMTNGPVKIIRAVED